MTQFHHFVKNILDGSGTFGVERPFCIGSTTPHFPVFRQFDRTNTAQVISGSPEFNFGLSLYFRVFGTQRIFLLQVFKRRRLECLDGEPGECEELRTKSCLQRRPEWGLKQCLVKPGTQRFKFRQRLIKILVFCLIKRICCIRGMPDHTDIVHGGKIFPKLVQFIQILLLLLGGGSIAECGQGSVEIGCKRNQIRPPVFKSLERRRGSSLCHVHNIRFFRI